MDKIKGYIDHLIFRNSDNGYTVMVVNHEGEELTCVGTFPVITEGELIEATGHYTEHAVYGTQFQIQKLEIKDPEDTAAIERYLGSGVIKGIGIALAARIVRKFKEDTFRIMEEEPERLAEVKGISEKKAREISEQVSEKRDMRKAMIFLQQYGISNTLGAKIYKQYGARLYAVIQDNPYQMADDINGVGFQIADEIASKVGIHTDSDFRVRSGILHVLTRISLEGHVYLPKMELLARTVELLGVSQELVEKHIMDLAVERRLILKEQEKQICVYGINAYYTELNTAKMLHDLNISCKIDEKKISRRMDKLGKHSGYELDELQKEAVVTAAGHGLLVLTGGPGTGKTTTINAMIDYFDSEGLEVRLAAPTGRAAKRMQEATGCEAQTIHRMLEISGAADEEEGPKQFERNEENPLEADVIIVDEMSMVDIYLMNALLKAIAVGTRLILVGDVNQLPSVGPGNVLKDIIDSECFQVVRLTKIFRQALESDIIKNAHLINEGRQIELGNKSQDFFCLKRYDVQQILGVMVLLIRDKLPKFVNARPYDIQVLTPMRKGELGVERLNTVLQHYLNPPSPDKKEREFHQGVIREGDKVMQIRNNYQIEWEVLGHYNLPLDKGVGVFNGDMGVVREINHFAEQLVVEFDEGRRVTYGFAQLDELELAYAITIHKSQGSEYPAVIMPLLSGPRMLFNRNILYTAVTRAKQCVAIVGDEHTVRHMIENEKQQKRYTSLNLRLREMNTLS